MSDRSDDDRARQRRLGLVVGAAVLVAVAAGVGVVARNTDDTTTRRSAGASGTSASATSTTRRPGTTVDSTTDSTTTSSTSLVIPPSVGLFATLPGSGPVRGTGPLHTYRVEAEVGSGVDVEAFAGVVDSILGDPRGWIADGGAAFQRVEHGGSFTITLATPNTTDAICLPLRTNGKFSCREGNRAVINLRRWMEGTVDLPLDVPEYRANVINHEVGHVLGHGHVGCSGPGKRAPVMMQQSKGLNGCVANSWPTLDGTTP